MTTLSAQPIPDRPLKCAKFKALTCLPLILFASSAWTADPQFDARALEGYSQAAKFDVPAYASTRDSSPNSSNLTQDPLLTSSEHAINGLDSRHYLLIGSDIWISNIDARLFNDQDGDGYFSSFSLRVDANTRYSHAEVFANIAIEFPDGAREHLHTTADFDIYGNTNTGSNSLELPFYGNTYGNSFHDEYRVDIDLLRNYSIGQYNLFIELVETHSNRVVDQIGAGDISILSSLPLESRATDSNSILGQAEDFTNDSISQTDIRVVERAGSMGVWALTVLFLLKIFRSTYRHRKHKR